VKQGGSFDSIVVERAACEKSSRPSPKGFIREFTLIKIALKKLTKIRAD
jgi:hypothetical protein